MPYYSTALQAIFIGLNKTQILTLTPSCTVSIMYGVGRDALLNHSRSIIPTPTNTIKLRGKPSWATTTTISPLPSSRPSPPSNAHACNTPGTCVTTRKTPPPNHPPRHTPPIPPNPPLLIIQHSEFIIQNYPPPPSPLPLSPGEVLNEIQNLAAYPKDIAKTFGLTESDLQTYLNSPEFQNHLQLVLTLSRLRTQLFAAECCVSIEMTPRCLNRSVTPW